MHRRCEEAVQKPAGGGRTGGCDLCCNHLLPLAAGEACPNLQLSDCTVQPLVPWGMSIGERGRHEGQGTGYQDPTHT